MLRSGVTALAKIGIGGAPLSACVSGGSLADIIIPATSVAIPKATTPVAHDVPSGFGRRIAPPSAARGIKAADGRYRLRVRESWAKARGSVQRAGSRAFLVSGLTGRQRACLLNSRHPRRGSSRNLRETPAQAEKLACASVPPAACSLATLSCAAARASCGHSAPRARCRSARCRCP
jgi:hypothetical protein